MTNFYGSAHWDDVTTRDDKYVYHGHRINIQNMSEADRKALCQELTDGKIEFEVRNASVDSDTVHKGDLTIRVIDPKSVDKLRYNYFQWTYPGPHRARPTRETIAEYDQKRQEAKKRREQAREQEIMRLRERLADLTGNEDPQIPVVTQDNTR